MFKTLLLIAIVTTLLKAQSPSFILTQEGGDRHNSIFLNPSKLSLYKNKEELEVTLINASLLLSRDEYRFLDELSATTSSANKNKEISTLLNKNIGHTISLLADNFSSLQGRHQNLFYALGFAETFNASYIPHSGFGSKGALESSIEKYRILMATLASKYQSLHYGINLKSMKKTLQNHNYSIQEMINAQDLKTYLSTSRGESHTAIGVDAGLSYQHSSILKPTLHLSLLNIGNTSFQEIGTLPSTMNLGVSLEPYEKTFLTLDYLDLFKAEAQQSFHQQIRLNLTHTLFEMLQINSGLLNNALLYGFNYQHRFFNIGLHSYHSNHQYPKRRYELSFKIKW